MLVQSRGHDVNLMHGMKKFVSSARQRKDNNNEPGPKAPLSHSAAVQEPSQISADASSLGKNQPWTSHFKRGISLRSPSASSVPVDDAQSVAGAPAAPKPRKKVPYGMYGWRYEDEIDVKPNEVKPEEFKPKLAVVNPSPSLLEVAIESRPASVNLARASSVSTSHSSDKASSIHSPKQRKKIPYGMYGFRYADDDEPSSSNPAGPVSPVLANAMAKTNSKDAQASSKSPRASIASNSEIVEAPNSPKLPKRKKVPFGMYGWRYEDEIDPRRKPSVLSNRSGRNSIMSQVSIDPSQISELPEDSISPFQQRHSSFGIAELPGRPNGVPELPAAVPVEKGTASDHERAFPAIRDIDWSKVEEEDLSILLKYFNNAKKKDSGVASPEENGPAAYVGKGKGRAETGNEPLEASKSKKDMQSPASQSNPPLDLRIKSEGKRKEIIPQDPLEEEYVPQISDFDIKQAARLQARKEADERERQRRFQIELELAREAELKLRLKECPVCGDTKEPLAYPTRAATRSCTHTCNICTECTQSWIASEFETKGCDNILCPECPSKLSYDDVQRAATPVTFAAFDALCARNALNASDEFAWCLAPGCSSGQINIDNNSFMDCATCGYKQCLTHKVPWHIGETCAQYEYRTSGAQAREEERQSEALLEGISKRCPGENCGWRIQKLDGCDHMTCRRCRHEFCWLCLAAQKEIRRVGNTAHKDDCPYHSDNLEIAWPFNAH